MKPCLGCRHCRQWNDPHPLSRNKRLIKLYRQEIYHGSRKRFTIKLFEKNRPIFVDCESTGEECLCYRWTARARKPGIGWKRLNGTDDAVDAFERHAGTRRRGLEFTKNVWSQYGNVMLHCKTSIYLARWRCHGSSPHSLVRIFKNNNKDWP